MRKLLSLMLCMVLLSSMVLPAFATEGGSTESVHEHSWGEGSVTTEASCTAPGVKTYTCSCGETKTENLDAAGHAFGSWAQAGEGHERVCGTCGEKETGAHSMSSQVTTEPTCKDKGVKTNSCSACGFSYTEEIAVSSTHSYGEWDGDEGSHIRTCGVCGATDSGAHSWSSENVTVPATCKEEGVSAILCTVCGGALYEVLPKLTTHTYDDVCDADCNVCGAKRDTAHKFSAVWTKNYKEHWHACTRCGEKSDIGDHYPGPAATEEKDQICLTCGYVMTPKKGHVHKYSEDWSSDETGHWYPCEGCEDQKDFAYHEYDDLCDPDCNICGFESPTAHSYDETWSSDEAGHWTACVLCNEEVEKEAHTPDPNAAETDALLCTVCGFEIAPAQKHVHEAGEDWLTDEESHWKTCECGEKLDEAAHAWNEGTENEDTTVTYVCTECGAEKTEGEPKEPGSFPFGIVLAVLGVIAVGLVVALVILLRSGKKSSGKFAK